MLSVVLFHYRIWPFSGGYVGVDIFFVISGYLITNLINNDLLRNRHSIVTFYERRIRRIFPALFVLLAVTTPLSLWLLFPYHLVRYGDSLAATAAFSSNFEFWRESGYFDFGAESKPLIHTWSLAVEEQFYLAFPWLLHSLRNRPQLFLVSTLSGIAALSFAFGVWAVRFHPDLAFYLPPARAWELLLGGVLALVNAFSPRSALFSNTIAWGGLALIAYAVLFFSSSTQFPGSAAIVPCMGAACIIYAGTIKKPLFNQVLSTRPFVFVGLISYSLYLWHWPLFVFASYYNLGGPSGLQKILLVGSSFALATISWRFVETPFRRKNSVFDRNWVFRAAGIAVSISVLAGGTILYLQGLPDRFSPELRSMFEAAGDSMRPIKCLPRTDSPTLSSPLCLIGANRSAPPTLLLWGDSESTAILPAIDSVARKENRVGLFAQRDGCPPLLGVSRSGVVGCPEFNDASIKLALLSNIQEVILVGRWALYAEGTSYGIEQGTRVILTDQKTGNYSTENNHDVFTNSLERTVHRLSLAGKKIIFVNSTPEFAWPLPDTLVKIKLLHENMDITLSLNDYEKRQAFVSDTIYRLRKNHRLVIVEPSSILCPARRCVTEFAGKLLYKDDRHINFYGAKQLVPLFESVM